MANQNPISSTEREKIIKQKAAAIGIPAEELAKLLLLGEIMKAPSELEQQRIDDEQKRKMDALLEQARIENSAIANRLRYQKYCTHTKNDGKLGIGGQIIGPDNNRIAFVQCNNEYCKKTWMWKATQEEVTQGICINDDPIRPRFQTAALLDLQEQSLPIDPDFARIVGHPEVAERHEGYLKDMAKTQKKQSA